MTFKFTGNFKAGSTYLVTADTMVLPMNINEYIDDFNISSNNHFIFEIPSEPEPEPEESVSYPPSGKYPPNLGISYPPSGKYPPTLGISYPPTGKYPPKL